MPSGGARARSGPAPDLNSGRSEKRGVVFSALPRDGFKGKIPKFPLPKMALGFWNKDGEYIEDSQGEESFADREKWLWEWAWRTPQAIAWAREPWRWHGVAMWVRTAAICESAEAMAADKNSLHRFADQVGLTPAGLSENAWQISGSIDPSQVEPVVTKQGAPRESSRSRLPSNVKVVKGGGR